MGIPYLNIAKAVMVRSGQMGDGVDAADLDTLFDGALSSAWEGMDFPRSALKEQVLASAKVIASLIARVDNPVLYAELLGQTASLESGEEILPTVGPPFVGTYLAVKDDGTDEELTEKPKQEVRRLIRLIANGLLPAETYHYCRAGRAIYHTRDAVYLEGIVWDDAAQAALYAAGNSPIPTELEVFWTAHVLDNLSTEDWSADPNGTYAGVVQQCRQDLAQGVIPTAKMPDTTANVEPVKN